MEHQTRTGDPMWEALLAELLEDGYTEEWDGAAVGLFSDPADFAGDPGYHTLAKCFTVPGRRSERRSGVLDEIMELLSADMLSNEDKCIMICRSCGRKGKRRAGGDARAIRDV